MPRIRARRSYTRRRYSTRYRRTLRRYSRYYPMLRRVKYVNNRSTSTCNVKIIRNHYVPVQVASGAIVSDVVSIPAFADTEASSYYVSGSSLLNAPVYRLYTALYDEVKVRGVQYQITFTNPNSVGATYSSCNFYSTLDRRWGDKETPPTATAMLNICTCSPVQLASYRVPIVTRYYAARDLIEKVQYHDCTLAEQDGFFYDIAIQGNKNPNFYSPNFKFCFQFPTTASAANTFMVNIRCVYYLTFRNPRPYNGTASGMNPAPASVQSLEATSKAVHFDDDEDVLPKTTLASSTTTST